MPGSDRISRRAALTLGIGAGAAASARPAPPPAGLPAREIQDIIGATGIHFGRVLALEFGRDDLGPQPGPLEVEFDAAFGLDGELRLQPLRPGLAFLNGEVPVAPEEATAVLDASIAHGLTFQALYQRFPGATWTLSLRGVDEPLALAGAVRAVLDATGLHLPQELGCAESVRLDAERLTTLLRAPARARVRDVLVVSIPRGGRVELDHVQVDPGLCPGSRILFKALDGPADAAAALAQFAMSAHQVQAVTSVMRAQGWLIGGVGISETAQQPQLYRLHALKTGDPDALAGEARLGLDQAA